MRLNLEDVLKKINFHLSPFIKCFSLPARTIRVRQEPSWCFQHRRTDGGTTKSKSKSFRSGSDRFRMKYFNYAYHTRHTMDAYKTRAVKSRPLSHDYWNEWEREREILVSLYVIPRNTLTYSSIYNASTANNALMDRSPWVFRLTLEESSLLFARAWLFPDIFPSNSPYDQYF